MRVGCVGSGQRPPHEKGLFTGTSSPLWEGLLWGRTFLLRGWSFAKNTEIAFTGGWFLPRKFPPIIPENEFFRHRIVDNRSRNPQSKVNKPSSFLPFHFSTKNISSAQPKALLFSTKSTPSPNQNISSAQSKTIHSSTGNPLLPNQKPSITQPKTSLSPNPKPLYRLGERGKIL